MDDQSRISAMIRSPRRAFTLIELLIVIGIIALLIALVIPIAGRMRESARRSEELSSLRQLTAACIIYAHDNDEMLPIGRLVAAGGTTAQMSATGNVNNHVYGPNNPYVSGAGGGYGYTDDYTWINYRDCWRQLVYLVPKLDTINSCSSVRTTYTDADDFGKPQADYGYPDDTRVGWIYWGGRDDLTVNGKLQYRSLRRIGQHLTPGSQTLWTCWCWDSAGYGSPSMCPHVGVNCVTYPNGVALKPPPDALGIALDDGSASFVNWNDMVIIPQANGYKLYYQP